MLRHLNAAPILASQDIVSSVALIIDILGAHQCTHAAVIIVSLQLVAVRVRIVIVVQ